MAPLRALANQGGTDALTDAVKKRIRMTNVLSVFGAVLMAASVPFDALEAPRWMRGRLVLLRARWAQQPCSPKV